ncbi:hypothetical protein FAF44_36340 [Nonomuraea sp. MG754425]|uniref:hypothetical protein n=1 Tax=Nonomuraea sp. MG754425 TaxID=2570319 RepID=UPI001F3CBC4F|nr:hypothetical protein [Nonomuraea sp. MG754425]MCF6473815.1 hypothetical protein [Nonomuraea sp. MG754425]
MTTHADRAPATRQPVDHRDPGRGWFEQRIMLQHRSYDRPMVFHLTGHNVLPAGERDRAVADLRRWAD